MTRFKGWLVLKQKQSPGVLSVEQLELARTLRVPRQQLELIQLELQSQQQVRLAFLPPSRSSFP